MDEGASSCLAGTEDALPRSTREVMRHDISWSSYMHYLRVSFSPVNEFVRPSDRSPSVCSTAITASYGALETFQMTDGGTTLRVSSSSKAEDALHRIHIKVEG